MEAGYAWIDFGGLGGSNSLESLDRLWKSEGLEWSWRIKKLGWILGSEKLRKYGELGELRKLRKLGSLDSLVSLGAMAKATATAVGYRGRSS